MIIIILIIIIIQGGIIYHLKTNKPTNDPILQRPILKPVGRKHRKGRVVHPSHIKWL